MNIVKWIGAIIGLGLVMIAIATSDSSAEMYAKPVHCGPLDSIITEWDKEGMYPLAGFGGMSWLEDGSQQPTVVVAIVNEYGRFAIMEKNASFFCLLAAGNVVEYNSEAIKQLMEWE